MSATSKLDSILLKLLSRSKHSTDQISGGKADETPDSGLDQRALASGVGVELEHTSSPDVAKEIAKDHIVESGPAYYDELKNMEAGLKKARLGCGSSPSDKLARVIGTMIRFAEQAEPFHSKAEQVIRESAFKVTEKAKPERVRNVLLKHGVKPEEMQWSGLNDKLASSAGTVSKADLLGHIKEHGFQIKPIVYGGGSTTAEIVERAHNDLREQLGRINSRNLAEAEPHFQSWLESDGSDHAAAAKINELLRRSGLRRWNRSLSVNDAVADAKKSLGNEKGEHLRYSDDLDLNFHGGENPVEMLLTAPVKPKVITEVPESFRLMQEESTDGEPIYAYSIARKLGGRMTQWEKTPELAKQVAIKSLNAIEQQKAIDEAYHEPHWKGVPNVLAHLRMNDRTGPNGEKIAFIEEIQSKLHQEDGRRGYRVHQPIKWSEDDRGVRTGSLGGLAATVGRTSGGAYYASVGAAVPDGNTKYNIFGDRQEAERYAESSLRQMEKEQWDKNKVPPDLPFKDTWHELAMKHAIDYAVRHGHDGIAWTTGDQQNDRYNLRKFVDRLEWNGRDNTLLGIKDGKTVASHSDVTKDDLKKYVGREMADKLIASQEEGESHWGHVEGKDLEIGGHGKRHLYDAMLPGFMNRFGKKWGVRTGSIEIKTSPVEGSIHQLLDHNYKPEMERLYDDVWNVYHPDESGNVVTTVRGRTRDEALEGLHEALISGHGLHPLGNSTETVHYMPITPEMREEIMSKGQYRFSRSGVVDRLSRAADSMVRFAAKKAPAVFHSKARQVIEGLKQSSAPANQMRSMLSGLGVKPEEMKWTGLDAMLAALGSQPVTKKQLLDHIKKNQLPLKEILYGEPKKPVAAEEIDRLKSEHKKAVDELLEVRRAEADKRIGLVQKSQLLADKISAATPLGKEDLAFKYADMYAKKHGMPARSSLAKFAYGRGGQGDSSYNVYSKSWHRTYGPAKWKNAGVFVSGGNIVIENHLGKEVHRVSVPDAMKELGITNDGDAAEAKKLSDEKRVLDAAIEDSLRVVRAKEGEVATAAKKVHDASNPKVARKTKWGLADWPREELELPLGKDYRELVMQLPSLGKGAGEIGSYESGHWSGVKNPIAHVRFNTRIGPNGEKLLHLEELQSDWHQEGRESGYDNPQRIKEIHRELNRIAYLKSDRAFSSPEFNRMKLVSTDRNGSPAYQYVDQDVKDLENLSTLDWRSSPEDARTSAALSIAEKGGLLTKEEEAEENRLTEELGQLVRRTVHDAPFKGERWAHLLIKRMIHHAAANGYDAITWTPGEQQAERYNKMLAGVTKVSWQPETGHLTADMRGHTDKTIAEKVSAADLRHHVGADMAAALLDPANVSPHNETWRSIEGDNIKVGGAGFKKFYDEIVPKIINKHSRSMGWDAEVGGTTIKTLDKKKNPVDLPVQKFPITDAVREHVMTKGQAQFARDGSLVRLSRVIDSIFRFGKETDAAPVRLDEEAAVPAKTAPVMGDPDKELENEVVAKISGPSGARPARVITVTDPLAHVSGKKRNGMIEELIKNGVQDGKIRKLATSSGVFQGDYPKLRLIDFYKKGMYHARLAADHLKTLYQRLKGIWTGPQIENWLSEVDTGEGGPLHERGEGTIATVPDTEGKRTPFVVGKSKSGSPKKKDFQLGVADHEYDGYGYYDSNGNQVDKELVDRILGIDPNAKTKYRAPSVRNVVAVHSGEDGGWKTPFFDREDLSHLRGHMQRAFEAMLPPNSVAKEIPSPDEVTKASAIAEHGKGLLDMLRPDDFMPEVTGSNAQPLIDGRNFQGGEIGGRKASRPLPPIPPPVAGRSRIAEAPRSGEVDDAGVSMRGVPSTETKAKAPPPPVQPGVSYINEWQSPQFAGISLADRKGSSVNPGRAWFVDLNTTEGRKRLAALRAGDSAKWKVKIVYGKKPGSSINVPVAAFMSSAAGEKAGITAQKLAESYVALANEWRLAKKKAIEDGVDLSDKKAVWKNSSENYRNAVEHVKILRAGLSPNVNPKSTLESIQKKPLNIRAHGSGLLLNRSGRPTRFAEFGDPVENADDRKPFQHPALGDELNRSLAIRHKDVMDNPNDQHAHRSYASFLDDAASALKNHFRVGDINPTRRLMAGAAGKVNAAKTKAIHDVINDAVERASWHKLVAMSVGSQNAPYDRSDPGFEHWLRRINKEPLEESHRLIMADYVEENYDKIAPLAGDPETASKLAELIRADTYIYKMRSSGVPEDDERLVELYKRRDELSGDSYLARKARMAGFNMYPAISSHERWYPNTRYGTPRRYQRAGEIVRLAMSGQHRFSKTYNDIIRSAARHHFTTPAFHERLMSLSDGERKKYDDSLHAFLNADLLGIIKRHTGGDEDLTHRIATKAIFELLENYDPKKKDANLLKSFVSFIEAEVPHKMSRQSGPVRFADQFVDSSPQSRINDVVSALRGILQGQYQPQQFVSGKIKRATPSHDTPEGREAAGHLSWLGDTNDFVFNPSEIKAAHDFFGRPIDMGDLIKAANGQHNHDITITRSSPHDGSMYQEDGRLLGQQHLNWDRSPVLVVTSHHDGHGHASPSNDHSFAKRIFYRDRDGKIRVYNDYMVLGKHFYKEHGTGVARQMAHEQIQALDRLGVSKIHAQLEQSPDAPIWAPKRVLGATVNPADLDPHNPNHWEKIGFQGGKVWPLAGYGGDYDATEVDHMPSDMKSIVESGGNYDVRHLIDNVPGGAEWWANNPSVIMHGYFDIARGTPTREAHEKWWNDYSKKKGIVRDRKPVGTNEPVAASGSIPAVDPVQRMGRHSERDSENTHGGGGGSGILARKVQRAPSSAVPATAKRRGSGDRGLVKFARVPDAEIHADYKPTGVAPRVGHMLQVIAEGKQHPDHATSATMDLATTALRTGDHRVLPILADALQDADHPMQEAINWRHAPRGISIDKVLSNEIARHQIRGYGIGGDRRGGMLQGLTPGWILADWRMGARSRVGRRKALSFVRQTVPDATIHDLHHSILRLVHNAEIRRSTPLAPGSNLDIDGNYVGSGASQMDVMRIAAPIRQQWHDNDMHILKQLGTTPESPHTYPDTRPPGKRMYMSRGGNLVRFVDPNQIEFRPATAREFIAARDRSKRKEFLSHHSEEELNGKNLFLSHDGTIGYMLDEHGDLGNVFNNGGPKGGAHQAIEHAIKNGAKTLDCFDGYLPGFYAGHGFVPTGAMKFNDEFAPHGWDYEAHKRPDIIFMAYTGEKDASHRERPTYADFDQAKLDSRRSAMARQHHQEEGRVLGGGSLEAIAEPTGVHPDPLKPPGPSKLRRMLGELHRFAVPGGQNLSDFAGALQRMQTMNHGANIAVLKQVLDSIGFVPHKILPVLHDMGSTTRPAVAAAVAKRVDQPAALYAASWSGLLNRQPGMLAFQSHDDGPDSIYRIGASGSGNALKDILERNGIGQSVFVPKQSGEFHVLIHDPGRQLRKQVAAVARELNTNVGESRGTGTILGGKDPASSRAEFRSVIRDTEGT